jgi:thiol-disulfide isomerase/thioredoxin
MLPINLRLLILPIFAIEFATMFSTGCAAVQSPRIVSVQRISDLSVPDSPYNTDADADRDVAAALEQARTQKKRVLIDLGGNWCPDCRILAAIMELPEARRFLDTYFVVVSVDVGRMNRNLQIPAQFGIKQRLEGVPAVLVVDTNGTLLDGGHIFALDDARSMTPQAVVDWLALWAR